ncbi:hypothetical protein NH14_024960 [Paraburkholderia sacchari]|uniref:Uncharacterized protein n=2 Tax=Paraburkholderia sacchari TaxID=159450 RepID=A0A8T6ZGL5_9BURK|nr:hypothetical protein [Paraburkholderia sacchari]
MSESRRVSLRVMLDRDTFQTLDRATDAANVSRESIAADLIRGALTGSAGQPTPTAPRPTGEALTRAV